MHSLIHTYNEIFLNGHLQIADNISFTSIVRYLEISLYYNIMFADANYHRATMAVFYNGQLLLL